MIDLPILDAAAADEQTPRHWRSPAHLHRDPAYERMAQHEFMPGVTEAPSGASRRQFLQLMGASMALAGLSACRRPVEEVLPFVRKPEEIIPGVPLLYATAMPFRGVARPLLVESHEGRPTKVEANPDHPSGNHGTSVFEQASILNLYDPDRSKTVLREGANATWQEFVTFARSLTGGRVVVLAEPSSSPSMQAMRQQLAQRFSQVDWITYHAGGDDPEQLGVQQALGRPLRPQYNFSNARVIVSLDADFTGPTDRNGPRNSREFAESRRLGRPGVEMSRLYVVESAYTPTGSLADHRLRLRASDIPALAMAIAARLGMSTSAPPSAAPAPGGQPVPPSPTTTPSDTADVTPDTTGLPLGTPGAGRPITEGERFVDHPFVIAMADDLREAGAGAVVLAGETQPPAVHALCAAINGALGSTVVEYLDTGEEPVRPQAQALTELLPALVNGQVDLLICLGTNPAYDAPADLNMTEAIQGARESIHIGLHVDETARACRWHLPGTHYLESWGDARAYDGTLSVIQPLIAPLYDAAHSDLEILNLLATGEDRAGYDLVRETWRGTLSGDFEKSWRQALHDGFVPNTAYATTGGGASAPSFNLPDYDATALEVVFRLDPTVLDGSFANNAWCQELPDPMTKIVWDNVAVMSPATARQLGVASEYDEGNYEADIIEITVGDRSVQLPVWEMPGHPDGSITLNMGYGRDITSRREHRHAPFFDTNRVTDVYGAGAVATGIGQNVAPLRPTSSTAVVLGATVRATGETYQIVTTQDHGAIDPQTRPLARMGTLAEYRDNPTFAQEMGPPSPAEPFSEYPMLWEDEGGEKHPKNTPAYKDSLYYKNQWGMSIDLNTCNGCNACVVACQSENNIQVVGKEQVSRGRELHWLRLDRYFVTPHEDLAEHTEQEAIEEEIPANPMVMLQPMLCQHCENAPCESVCPVAATVHSPDGINAMIYNRCIGTRYCSNNCPYKVRRYNWFNWTSTLPVEVQMAQNPNVTMRFRGVMEKCSWCMQRIRGVQRRANLEDRTIRDGEVQTACQQACPSDAIVFGDLTDPFSKVVQAKKDPRTYAMLAELNVQPRLTYLARIRNPNPRLEPAV